MRRALAVPTAALGPAAVALLRFLLPYYTAPDAAASARAVVAAPDRQSAVLWLGLVALLTLVPGLFAVRDALPGGRLRSVGLGLTTAGYLCLPVLLVGDNLLWVAARQGLDATLTGGLMDGLHPMYTVATVVFVVGHVVGTTVLGVLCLRTRALPPAVAAMLLVSQPLHLLTTVVLGLAWVDLIAWGMTAVAMGWLAAEAGGPAVRRARPASRRSREPGRAMA